MAVAAMEMTAANDIDGSGGSDREGGGGNDNDGGKR
jgi:hypothetical protein